MTGVSTLGQSLSQIDRLRTLQSQLDTLSVQLSTGRKTTLYKGLENDVVQSQRTRADLNHIETFQRNINSGEIRMNLMLNSVEEIESQVGLALDFVNIEVVQGQVDLQQVVTAARNGYDVTLDNLNQKDGDVYLFAGSDSDTRPVTDTGALDTYIRGQLEDWRDGNVTTNQLIANIQGTGDDPVNDTLVGFSATLSVAKNVTVRADENVEVNYTVKADDAGYKDVLVALSVLKNLPVNDSGGIDLQDSYDSDGFITQRSQIPPAGLAEPETQTEKTILENQREEEFFQLYDALAGMLSDGKREVFDDRMFLENAKGRIARVEEDLQFEKSVAEDIIADIEQIDINETAIKLNSIQLQLEASYNVTSSIRRLSLVNFI